MKRLLSRIALLIIANVTASAQLISVGVKGGGSLLEPALQNDESKRYLIGPSVEIRLPANFALEADALYQRIGTTTTLNYFGVFTNANQGVLTDITAPIQTINRQRANSWEFPLLGKYYLGHYLGARPFVGAGFSFRTLGIEAQGNSIIAPVPVPPIIVKTGPFQSNYRSDLGVGAVVAGGLRYKVGRISVIPEIRYTRWGSNDSLTRKNAVSALIGLSF